MVRAKQNPIIKQNRRSRPVNRSFSVVIHDEHQVLIKANAMDSEQLDRVIEMAWEDRTPFEAIEYQFGLMEKEVISLMRQSLKPGSFRSWRKRVSGRKTKHAATSNADRFKAACHS
ncbi:conserved hypothetical protein [Synechococcus sp. CC9311]|nr:conserved hypothetical protein [Synechococcus sp. CC9311]